MTLGHSTMSDAPVTAPGRGPHLLALLQAAAQALDEVPGAVHQLGSAQEDELVTVLLRLHGRAAHIVTVVTSDAADRGAIAESHQATTTQWLNAHLADSRVEPKTVRAIAAVADACRHPNNTVIATALSQGTCSVESAQTALTQADKVAPVIPTAQRGEILGWFLHVDPALGRTGLTQLTRRIIARFAPDHLCDGDQKLENTETLSWSTTPTGMTRLVAELSPANAAIIKDAITAGSAPQPTHHTGNTADPTPAGRAIGLGPDCGPDRTGPTRGAGAACGPGNNNPPETPDPATGPGEPARDQRSPGKRRVDALMDLVGAGARTTTGDGIQASAATVLLTMGLHALRNGHGASTTSGDLIDAGAARRFACTADLIPAVLGGPSQPLDVGRRERLATKTIRAAVILRDGGCTFPGVRREALVDRVEVKDLHRCPVAAG